MDSTVSLVPGNDSMTQAAKNHTYDVKPAPAVEVQNLMCIRSSGKLIV
jgi:hypothetical protein